MTRSLSLVRSSFIFSGLTLISRFLGLARDLVITAVMGASGNIFADAYNTALQFPNLFRRIFAEGAFTAAFVPSYAAKLEAEGEEAANRLARDTLATLAAVTLLLCLIFQAAMPWIMRIYSSGYLDDPEKFRLTVLLTQITMPYLPAMAIVALLSGLLNAKGRFVISALAPTLLNVIMLALVWPQTTPERAAYAASIGVMISGIAQVGLLLWAVRRSGARLGWAWPGLSPEVKGLFALAVPGALAASATQINVFVSQWLSSSIDGARTWLSVADRLYQLPLGLVGVAIGVALLPALSRAVGANDPQSAQRHMDQAVIFSLLFSFPAVAAILGMPHYLIDALFGRGLFNDHDVSETAKALFHYGWGVPAFVLARVLNPAFFARKDTYGPMRFALVSVVVNLALGLSLFPVLGVAGLAIATSAAAWANVVIMWLVLARRGFWKLSPTALKSLLRILVAFGLVVIAFFGFEMFRAPLEQGLAYIWPFKAGIKEFSVVILCFGGLILYTALILVFKAMSIKEFKAALARKG